MGSPAGGLQLPGALAAGPSCHWLRAATWHSSWSPASQVGGCRMEPGRRSRLALLTDLYQFTMAYGYWRAGRHWEPAEFELSFRRCPFQGGFALGAGLGECLAFLRGFSLSQAGRSPAEAGGSCGQDAVPGRGAAWVLGGACQGHGLDLRCWRLRGREESLPGCCSARAGSPELGLTFNVRP